ncbi:hypothetical protein T10_3796 [Trichinella papuae]|uniref:Uncharacterized protein n=1 Tax=Trichinella papuae TaxID=268474 RepID=A0A0V1M8B2_9BILA|nr:hypothetical protein T10_3796 [Trichinella papuae]
MFCCGKLNRSTNRCSQRLKTLDCWGKSKLGAWMVHLKLYFNDTNGCLPSMLITCKSWLFPEYLGTGLLFPLLPSGTKESPTDNNLEGWYKQLSKKAIGNKLGYYKLLQFLIEEQGVMEPLIYQVLSGDATVGDLRRVNRVYDKKQRQVIQYTGEYISGMLAMEQLLEALMYITPEPI